ncbi:MAG: hypothetical protein LBE82_02545 [Chitinophagaceae bacterium]|jgi:hypothetical protein|nr:hypothetical protein [Chitinophagaceae bacterium]
MLSITKLNRAGIVSLAFFLAITGCSKKELSSTGGTTPTPPTPPSATLLTLLDSVYLYAHQVYFWNEHIPSYAQFNPSQYANGSSSDSVKLFQELFAFTVTYNSAINAQTGRSYEFYADDSVNTGDYPGPKYSYFEDSTTYGSTSAIANSSDYLGGTDYGFGFYPGLWSTDTLIIRYVEKGSPFDKNSIQRGDILLSINGTPMTFNGSTATNNARINLVNSLLNPANTASASFQISRVRKGVTDTVNIQNLAPQYFTYNPVFRDTVVTSATGKKVGYIAYQSFTDWTKSSATVLQNAFTAFAGSSITELVIDLRYNGGGYVESSENFANLAAPSSANGKKMFTEYYNDTMTAGKATLLANQGMPTNASYYSVENNTFNFSKMGSVSGLSRVIFLVSDGTASASELLINNLKPYLNVILIGTQWETGSGDRTYGKPVGFFPINIGKYVYYMPEFASGNATDPAGGASYYSGMPVDNTSTDDARYNFGEPKETSFAQALYYIDNGGFNPNYNGGYLANAQTLNNLSLKKAFKQPSSFNGMIHNNSIKKRQ